LTTPFAREVDQGFAADLTTGVRAVELEAIKKLLS
jgi:hypothetical protein